MMRDLVERKEKMVAEDETEVMWYVIESRLLDNEQILLVTEKKYLKEARAEHPDKAIYFPPEIRELCKNKDAKDFIKLVHEAKKEFKGWIVPSDKQGGNDAGRTV
jgi:hypothetical protein